MKCLIVYNPRSGKTTGEATLDIIKDTLAEKYDEFEVVETVPDRNELIERVRQRYAEADTIVVSGGDGTFNSVAEAMANRPDRKPILYVPRGTVNDLAHIQKIPLETKAALQLAYTGEVTSHPAIWINNRLVTYFCGTGIFTTSSYQTPQIKKNKIGKLAYYLEVIRKDAGRKGVRMTIDTEEGYHDSGKFSLVVIVRGNRIGGLNLNKKKEFDDLIDFTVVKRKGKGTGFALLGNIFTIAATLFRGTDKKKNTKCYKFIRTRKIVLTQCDENSTWNMDGEKGYTGDITAEILPRQYELFTPKKA